MAKRRIIKKKFGVTYSVERNRQIKSGKYKYRVVAKRPDGVSWTVADASTKTKALTIARRFRNKGR